MLQARLQARTCDGLLARTRPIGCLADAEAQCVCTCLFSAVHVAIM
jgi:hypothetical protein